MNTRDAIKDVLKKVMPSDSKIVVVPTIDDIRIGVFWPLNNDPKRPNKMSRTIAVIVTYEDDADFAFQSVSQKERGLERLEEELKHRLDGFDAEHSHPRHQAPPVDEWFIGSLIVGI